MSSKHPVIDYIDYIDYIDGHLAEITRSSILRIILTHSVERVNALWV